MAAGSRGRFLLFFAVVFCALWAVPPGLSPAAADEETLYADFQRSLDAVLLQADIEESGFRLLDHYLDIQHDRLGPLLLVTAIHDAYRRVVLFLVREDGTVAMKTGDIASNSWLAGKAVQTTVDVAGVGYRDLDGDGLRDIVIITICRNDTGRYAGETYPVGDVLFQSADGYYRDYRVSDKINRFDMNKTIDAVTSLVRDGLSMEFLFTAGTLDELVSGGLQLLTAQSVDEELERFGAVKIIPGFYHTVGINYLIIYCVDGQGRILWNFQPMGAYVNFYAIRGMSFRDIDGDGNKDFTVHGTYVATDPDGRYVLRQDYDIYYQRAGYFLEDAAVKGRYPCTEEDDIAAITDRAAAYWRGSHD